MEAVTEILPGFGNKIPDTEAGRQGRSFENGSRMGLRANVAPADLSRQLMLPWPLLSKRRS